MKSLLFVAIQFLCLGYYVFTGSFLLYGSALIIVQIAGFLMLLWAIITMNPSQWSIFPEPKKIGGLVVSGPYRWVRHPMYSGLLLISLAIVLHRQSVMDVAILLVFVSNLALKLSYEELLLQKQYPHYKDYKLSTWKIIPWLY